MTFRRDLDAEPLCKRCGRVTCEVAAATRAYDFMMGASFDDLFGTVVADMIQSYEDAVTVAQNRCDAARLPITESHGWKLGERVEFYMSGCFVSGTIVAFLGKGDHAFVDGEGDIAGNAVTVRVRELRRPQ